MKPRRATGKADEDDTASPAAAKKRKGESPTQAGRGKRLRVDDQEPGEEVAEDKTRDEAPNSTSEDKEASESSSEGVDAEAAALKDAAAREERRAA